MCKEWLKVRGGPRVHLLQIHFFCCRWLEGCIFDKRYVNRHSTDLLQRKFNATTTHSSCQVMNVGWLYLLCSKTVGTGLSLSKTQNTKTVEELTGSPPWRHACVCDCVCLRRNWQRPLPVTPLSSEVISVLSFLPDVVFLALVNLILWSWSDFVCGSGDRETGPVLPCSQMNLLDTTLNDNASAFDAALDSHPCFVVLWPTLAVKLPGSWWVALYLHPLTVTLKCLSALWLQEDYTTNYLFF